MFAALGGDATFSCSTCCSTSEWLSGEIRSQANPPFSLHLSLQSPLSCCLLAPSICRPLFVLCQTYVYERERQREMHGCILCLYIDLPASLLSLHFIPHHPPLLLPFSPFLPLSAHICDEIMRHIMGLARLVACIKVGELRDR